MSRLPPVRCPLSWRNNAELQPATALLIAHYSKPIIKKIFNEQAEHLLTILNIFKTNAFNISKASYQASNPML